MVNDLIEYSDPIVKSWLFFEPVKQVDLIESGEPLITDDQISQIHVKFAASIQTCRLLYENKIVQVVIKQGAISERGELIRSFLCHLVNDCGVEMRCKDLRHEMVVFGELKDIHVKILNQKETVSFIETRTGLQQAQSIVSREQPILFGYVFQFALFDQMIRDTDMFNPNIQLTEWYRLYTACPDEAKLKFNLKSNDQQLEYEIYLFQGDMTNVDADVLVNATNPELHPGYDGEGVSRRVREKAGKQMQDSLKKILNERKQPLRDSDLVLTKSSGKLKSKYVIHTVAPSWHKYVTNSSKNIKTIKSLEPLFEKTVQRVLNQFMELNMPSLGFPATLLSSTQAQHVGSDAFDLPIELFVHILVNQLLEYTPSESRNKKIKTYRLIMAHTELEKVKLLRDSFSYYNDTIMTTKWAMPISPMRKLVLAELDIDLDSIVEEKQVSEEPVEEESIIPRPTINLPVNQNNNNNSSLVLSSSSSSSLVNEPTPSSCLFCQREVNQLRCGGNPACKATFCLHCITNFIRGQRAFHKPTCPSCKASVTDETILGSLNHRKERSSESEGSIGGGGSNNNNGKPRVVRKLPDNHPYIQSGRIRYNSDTTEKKAPITDGEILIRLVNSPCEGYEKLRTIMITFQIPDGVQKENHPKPGLAYKGISKKVYLPEVKEHLVILDFFRRAFKEGLLFKLDWSKMHNEYRVLLGHEVLLKTNQTGGGRYGYPDPNYIHDILDMAKHMK